MTDKKIKAWKESGIQPVMIEMEDGKVLYFAIPFRKQMKLILSKGPKGGPIAMTDSFITNCYLDGEVDKEFLLTEEGRGYHSQIVASIDDLLGMKKVEVKKL
ncbi:MAG: hypothetical protein D6772_05810 [Bacteroidetes bacterium]|nr:MAG: hypothetical protein D6772_05810 [Bacteroidota bacterium]